MQKVTEHNGIIQYMSNVFVELRDFELWYGLVFTAKGGRRYGIHEESVRNNVGGSNFRGTAIDSLLLFKNNPTPFSFVFVR